MVPVVAFAAGLFLVGGAWALVWGFFVSTTLLWHGTFTINSLSHVFGRRRYETTDDSKNNLALALITLGEGWHNNHHHYQRATNQGFFWWEIDVAYYTLRAMSWVGLVRNIHTPPEKVLAVGRVAKDLKGPDASTGSIVRSPAHLLASEGWIAYGSPSKPTGSEFSTSPSE